MEKDNSGALSIDSLILELGDCGLLQAILVLAVHGSILPTRWSVMFMTFGNHDPGWKCVDAHGNNQYSSNASTQTLLGNNASHNSMLHGSSDQNTSHWSGCESCDVFDSCKDVVYNLESSTIASEWHLSCGRGWILSLILSLQIFGGLLGSLFAGLLNDRIGRKPTHFIGMALHVLFNIAAVFSVSWTMFAVMRVLIGITSGSIGVSNYVYPIEFITNKWRAVVTALPFSTFSALIFSLVTLYLRDWRILHIATAVVTAMLFLPIFCVPESIRWLAVKGKTEKAIKAAKTVEKLNGKKLQNYDIIHKISEQEKQTQGDDKSCSVLDLYRHGFMKRTIAVTYIWTSIVACATIVSFSITNLPGDFYLNFILFNLISTVTLPCIPFLTNILGRKLSIRILLGLSFLTAVGLMLTDIMDVEEDSKGMATRVLTFLIIVFVDGGFSVIALMCIEIYPTELRSLSFSHGRCMSRMFSMASPFLIPTDSSMVLLARAVMALLTVTSWAAVFFLPETKGRALDEYIIIQTKKTSP